MVPPAQAMQRSVDAPDITPNASGEVHLSSLRDAYWSLRGLYRSLQIRDNDKIDWINEQVAAQRKRFGVRQGLSTK